jgi:hypothetical protein
MEAWERSELAGVGEGLCPVGGELPLTQLRLATKGGKAAHPSPKGRGGNRQPLLEPIVLR